MYANVWGLPLKKKFVWGLVTLWLADEEFLPFDYLSYAKEFQAWLH